MTKTGVMVCGHGSRDADAMREFQLVAAGIRERLPQYEIESGYLEFARPMIRATNTGATVVIDRFGRVMKSLPRYTRGVLVGEVEGGTEMTPYARWVAHLGLVPLWLAAAAAAFVAWRAWRRRPQP